LRDSWALVYGLVRLAGVTARRGGPGRAARLFGAAKAMGEAASVTVAFSPAQALYEQDLANVRARPGTIQGVLGRGPGDDLGRGCRSGPRRGCLSGYQRMPLRGRFANRPPDVTTTTNARPRRSA
jgi:hypothetical protein